MVGRILSLAVNMNKKLYSGSGNFPFPTVLQKSLLNIPRTTATEGKLMIRRYQGKFLGLFFAGFPEKNVVNDGWAPRLIQNEQNC